MLPILPHRFCHIIDHQCRQKTHLVRKSTEIGDVCDMKHVQGQFVEFSISHAFGCVGILEGLNLQPFLWIQSKIATLNGENLVGPT